MKQIFTLFFALCMAGASVHAQVTYHDINPDTTVDKWSPYVIEYGSSQLYIWYHPFEPNQVVVNGFGIEVLFDGHYPAMLNAGTGISSSGNWREPQYDTMNIGGTFGYWIGVTDKYLPFRFRLDGQMHYAWLRMDVDATPTYFTVKDLAYNATPDAGLNAGDKGNSSIKDIDRGKPALTLKNRQAYITGAHDRPLAATVYTVTGQVLQRMAVAGDKIDLSTIPAGVYMLRLEDARNQFAYKIILP